MTRWVTATLVKLKSDDGLIEMNADVPLGKHYVVDLDSRRVDDLFNFTYFREHTKESIATRDGGRLPTDLLSIPNE